MERFAEHEELVSRYALALRRRAVGTTFAELQSPIVAALPFIAGLGGLLWLALRLRAQAPDRGTRTALPVTFAPSSASGSSAR